MKKEFNKEYILNNRGCYNENKVLKLSFINKENIHILDILTSEISLKDKGWFLIKKCELTLDEKKEISYNLAIIVLPIYEERYPEDKRIRECIEAITKFQNCEISKEELYTKHNNTTYTGAYAANAADAAYTANATTAAYTAYAAAAAYTTAAANAAYAAAYAANAAAYAAYAANDANDAVYNADATYKKLILQYLINFVNNN